MNLLREDFGLRPLTEEEKFLHNMRSKFWDTFRKKPKDAQQFLIYLEQLGFGVNEDGRLVLDLPKLPFVYGWLHQLLTGNMTDELEDLGKLWDDKKSK